MDKYIPIITLFFSGVLTAVLLPLSGWFIYRYIQDNDSDKSQVKAAMVNLRKSLEDKERKHHAEIVDIKMTLKSYESTFRSILERCENSLRESSQINDEAEKRSFRIQLDISKILLKTRAIEEKLGIQDPSRFEGE